jgi:CheY-like chemotaxis protein
VPQSSFQYISRISQVCPDRLSLRITQSFLIGFDIKEDVMPLLTGNSGTVMVVDDADDIRQLICMHLRWKGYQVVEATNGEQAVDLVRRSHPGLILMDLSMPVMDGYEATRRIKALPGLGEVPIVAVSAFCDPSDKHKALQAGCVECVSKPIDFPAFDSLVSRHLHTH